MKFWLNANLSPKLAAWIATTFTCECEALRDFGLVRGSDPEIFARAKKEQVVIVTKDSDFVDLVLRHGSPPQILLLTCGNVSNAALKTLLTNGFTPSSSFHRARVVFGRTRRKPRIFRGGGVYVI